MSEALVFYAQGNGPAAICSLLSINASAPSLRTINNWISRFKRIDAGELKYDHLYQWHSEKYYSIPNQARNLVFRILKARSNSTVREVCWWWKIKEMRDDILDDELISIAQECVINQHKEILEIDNPDWTVIWDKIQGYERDSTRTIRYSVLSKKYIVCTFELGQRLPEWVMGDELLSITQTTDQITVICEERPVPSDIQAERGWYCIKIPLGQRGFLSAVDQFNLDYRVVSIKKYHYFLFRDMSVDWIKKNIVKTGIQLEEFVS